MASAPKAEYSDEPLASIEISALPTSRFLLRTDPPALPYRDMSGRINIHLLRWSSEQLSKVHCPAETVEKLKVWLRHAERWASRQRREENRFGNLGVTPAVHPKPREVGVTDAVSRIRREAGRAGDDDGECEVVDAWADAAWPSGMPRSSALLSEGTTLDCNAELEQGDCRMARAVDEDAVVNMAPLSVDARWMQPADPRYVDSYDESRNGDHDGGGGTGDDEEYEGESEDMDGPAASALDEHGDADEDYLPEQHTGESEDMDGSVPSAWDDDDDGDEDYFPVRHEGRSDVVDSVGGEVVRRGVHGAGIVRLPDGRNAKSTRAGNKWLDGRHANGSRAEHGIADGGAAQGGGDYGKREVERNAVGEAVGEAETEAETEAESDEEELLSARISRISNVPSLDARQPVGPPGLLAESATAAHATATGTTGVRSSAQAISPVRKTKRRQSRHRCGQCSGCEKASACGKCLACKDMKCFGGPGVRREGCLLQRCQVPKRKRMAKLATAPAKLPYDAPADLPDEAEGITLHRSQRSKTGYVGVVWAPVDHRTKPFRVQLQVCGRYSRVHASPYDDACTSRGCMRTCLAHCLSSSPHPSRVARHSRPVCG